MNKKYKLNIKTHVINIFSSFTPCKQSIFTSYTLRTAKGVALSIATVWQDCKVPIKIGSSPRSCCLALNSLGNTKHLTHYNMNKNQAKTIF